MTVFRRLLAAIAGTALLVALASGSVHYLFASSLIQSSVRAQMESALATTVASLERTRSVPVTSDLRLLDAAPVINEMLASMGTEQLLARPAAERMVASISRANPDLYTAITLLDANARVRLAVHGGRRLRADLAAVTDAGQQLFARLAGEAPGTVRFAGPLRHADGDLSMLVGIAKRAPDTARFGGVIVAEVPLGGFAADLAAIKVLGHPVAWLTDAGGEVLVSPPAGRWRLDPRPAIVGGAAPQGGIALVSRREDDGSPLGLFRIAFSLSDDGLADTLGQAGARTLVVLVLLVLASCLLAWLLAREIASPMTKLSRLADAVGAGDLSQRIEQRWGGEEGRLARAFNRMLDALNATTVSRAYVNSIIESMGDAVLVVDRDGRIESVNAAAVDTFAGGVEALTGTPIEPLLPDAEVRSRFRAALAERRALGDVHAVLERPDGASSSLWLTFSPMHGADGGFAGLVVVARDVTEYQRARREVEQAHQALEFHVDNSPLAVVEWDADFRVRRWSRRAEALFGWRAEEVIGRHPDEWRFLHEADRDAAMGAVTGLVQGEPRNVHRNRNYCADGSVVYCEWHNSLMLDEQGAPVSVLSMAQDVTESTRLAEELSYQASHDALTGLMNRRAFDQRLKTLLAGSPDDGAGHALCFVDLDQFKVVNDSCGHVAGDELLRQVGGLLRQSVRRHDTVARLGGDEFAVLMEHCDTTAAARVAESILRALRAHPFIWDGKSFRTGASIGLVPITGEMRDREEIMRAADAACLAAKSEGRARVHVFDDHADLTRRRGEAEWVSRINKALEEDRFFLMAQPIAPASGAGTERFELLLRMTDEDGRVVSPGAFLPAAERYHLMPQLDRWVIRNALGLLAAAPPATAGRRMVFVNISGQTLADASLRDFVAHHLERTGADPQNLCFEITETAAVADFARANAFIDALSRLGCAFALDDFGSGVSSFAYLKNLPVEYLKIDGMFVRDVCRDATSLALVRSINEVGHAMGKRTVAEFVEDEATRECLAGMGVDFVQGYHIGRPVLAAGALGAAPRVAVTGAG